MTATDSSYPIDSVGHSPAPPREFMEAVRYCFSHYATFSGRASRSEFWWFALFNFIANLVLSFVEVALFGSDVSILSGIFGLVTIIPSIAVGARRLHDIGRSGWWQLIIIVPLIGWIVLIVWCARRGEPHANRFG